MRAEIISIGSEITSGQNLDTNSQWLSRKLAEMGISTAYHTTVADDLEANIEVFRNASQRADLVLCTGGLGPTQDDLTREVMAQVAGVELIEDLESLEYIKSLFLKRGRVMPDRNKCQALFPKGSEVLFNEMGTAPGIWMKINRAWFGAMPGVPSEMFVMYEKQVKPRLGKLGIQGGVFVQRKINTFGEGESAVEDKLLDITKRGHVPEVGITASDAYISLRIFARGSNLQQVQEIIEPVEAKIRERLGDLVFGTEDQKLQDAVVHLLLEKRKTISVVESVTGGLVSHYICQVPGASQVYAGGITAYQNRIKIDELGVPESLIREQGVVSLEVAIDLARRCRLKFGTDLAVSTVGYAGPEAGDDPAKPVGTVFSALSFEGGETTKAHHWLGTRDEIQTRTAKIALNLARLYLMKL
ncbi:competence/damage-inducible protein A [Telmatocola sphagniphila]|uniref:CinA-like protein n=1 Tax=Telmatocola sphagniphila TaxID=1123043 RepID=A0A8E6BA05_9BACT|nr:competence/damage-inducible protein A [Telmatocola sphagniphila]QVL33125.1 competence/damage-inducible protein A [Telmatocola sphagniphila]